MSKQILQESTHVLLHHSTGVSFYSSPCILKSKYYYFLSEVSRQQICTLSSQLHQSCIPFSDHVHFSSSLNLDCCLALMFVYVHFFQLCQDCLLVFETEVDEFRVRKTIVKLKCFQHQFFLLMLNQMSLNSTSLVFECFNPDLMSLHRAISKHSTNFILISKLSLDSWCLQKVFFSNRFLHLLSHSSNIVFLLLQVS